MPDVIHIKHPVNPIGIDMDRLYGPDRDGRYLKPTTVNYDGDADVVEIRLRAVLGDDLTQAVAPLVQQQRDRERIKALFNG